MFVPGGFAKPEILVKLKAGININLHYGDLLGCLLNAINQIAEKKRFPKTYRYPIDAPNCKMLH